MNAQPDQLYDKVIMSTLLSRRLNESVLFFFYFEPGVFGVKRKIVQVHHLPYSPDLVPFFLPKLNIDRKRKIWGRRGHWKKYAGAIFTLYQKWSFRVASTNERFGGISGNSKWTIMKKTFYLLFIFVLINTTSILILVHLVIMKKDKWKNKFLLNIIILQMSLCGVVDKVPAYDIVVSESWNSCYDVHFRINTLGKDMKPLIPP